MNFKMIFLVSAILGFLIPYYYFIGFLFDEGINSEMMFNQIFESRMAAFFTWDVIISSIACIAFIIYESKRLKIEHFWVYILFNLLVGVSLALPAFLYKRQITLEIQD